LLSSIGGMGPRTPERRLSLLVTKANWEADGVVSLELRSRSVEPLPARSAGAHVWMVLPSGQLSQHWLCGDPRQHDRYRLAVSRGACEAKDHQGFNELVRVGRQLRVSEPHNDFAFEPAPSYLFLAIEIGITAVLPMVRTLIDSGAQQWQLVYLGCSRSKMVFLAEVAALHPYRVTVLFEDEVGGTDLGPLIASQPSNTAVYGCGPREVLNARHRAVNTRPDLQVHFQTFTPSGGVTAVAQACSRGPPPPAGVAAESAMHDEGSGDGHRER
jgi:ferredoxin-NADP reductase